MDDLLFAGSCSGVFFAFDKASGEVRWAYDTSQDGQPANFHGARMNRLEAVKRVVAEFVAGNGDALEGRQGDLIGLIAFGTYADTVCPLVREYEPLLESLARVRIPIVDARSSRQGLSLSPPYFRAISM